MCFLLFFCLKSFASIILDAKELLTFDLFWNDWDSIKEQSIEMESVSKKPELNYDDKYIVEVRRLTTELSSEEVQLDKLMNNYVFENTPVGNVIMRYNHESSGFEYYCDNAVPYTILEVVCRKYVITFKCMTLYIDMENELKEYENKVKLENERKQKIQREQITRTAPNKKKVVFAKFKTYNTEAGTGRVGTGAPPKNSIPNINTNVVPNANVLLKERSNRYSYQGKTSNFSVTKKIDRRSIDKKLAMTFADFKKMNNTFV